MRNYYYKSLDINDYPDLSSLKAVMVINIFRFPYVVILTVQKRKNEYHYRTVFLGGNEMFLHFIVIYLMIFLID